MQNLPSTLYRKFGIFCTDVEVFCQSQISFFTVDQAVWLDLGHYRYIGNDMVFGIWGSLSIKSSKSVAIWVRMTLSAK